MMWLSRRDRNPAISDDVTATFGLPKAHKDAVLSHRTAVLEMTAFGASSSLRPIAAKVASLNRYRPLRLGGGNWSSCPRPWENASEVSIDALCFPIGRADADKQTGASGLSEAIRF